VSSAIEPLIYSSQIKYRFIEHITNEKGYGSLESGVVEPRIVHRIENTFGIVEGQIGIFACTSFPPGSIVTSYGGKIKFIIDFRSEEEKTHAIALRRNDNMFAICGFDFSKKFDRTSDIGTVCRLKTDISENERQRIMRGGCGYLMNHAARNLSNCKVVHIHPSNHDFNAGYKSIPCIVTKRHIMKGEELKYTYGSWRSRFY
jgi:hypothetical protein